MDNLADTMPFSKLMGIKIIDAKEDRIEGSLLVRPDLCTIGCIMHGGAMMAFADSLGAIGAFMNLPEGSGGTTTIESKTNFLSAARIDSVVLGICKPVKLGRKLSVWQTRLESEDGKLIALITQTQLIL
jgi:uncharacterized protein (TIGR00369 family)